MTNRFVRNIRNLSAGILVLIFWTPLVFAQECPEGKIVKTPQIQNLQFQWSLNMSARMKTCRILNPEVFQQRGARVTGCLPGRGGPQYILEPLGTVVNDCFSFPKDRYVFPAAGFEVAASQDPAPDPSRRILPSRSEEATTAIEPAGDPASGTIATPTARPPLTAAERKQMDLETYQRGDPVSVLLDDLMIENTGIKSSEEVDQYHMCLLSQNKGERAQKEKYYQDYRALIAYANRSFRVPIGLLACTCGRESRFSSTAKNGGASGVCQATGSFVEEINKFISRPGKIQDEWRRYIESIGNRIEHSSCRNLPLTKELILKCPSLGLGASAIYLRHIFARFEGKRDEMTEEDWARQSVESFAVASGAYNVGVTFADNVLDGVTDRKKWPNHLLKRTCQQWLVNSSDPAQRRKQLERAEHKFKELKNHLVALRNCLQKNNSLDHQGNSMKGDCAKTSESPEKQQQGLAQFRSTLPARCEMGQISNSPAADSSGRD